MKKTLLASVMFATFGMGAINAKPAKLVTPDEAKLFKYVVSYVTERVGSCEATYKVTTKYFLWKPISCCKQLVSKNCNTTPPEGGGGTGSNR